MGSTLGDVRTSDQSVSRQKMPRTLVRAWTSV